MYFWSIDKLKEDQRSGKFTEKDRFIYAFIQIALSIIGMQSVRYMSFENSNIWDKIISICLMVVPLVGTYCAYKANGASNGSDFLGRFYSISFVVFVRALVLLIPMFFVLIVYYMYAFPAGEDIVSTPMDTVPFVLWLAFVYLRVCRRISDVNNS